MRKLDITKQGYDFLDKLLSKQFKQVFTKIKNLRKNCIPHDSITLHGSADQHRVDVGEYRIIYKFDDDIVYIQTAGKRNDDEVYKKHKR